MAPHHSCIQPNQNAFQLIARLVESLAFVLQIRDILIRGMRCKVADAQHRDVGMKPNDEAQLADGSLYHSTA